MRTWADVEARAVAGRPADMARVAGGIDRYATSRVLRAGKLKPDAAGALRAVVAGGTVTERTAR
eukprot:11182498-Lingulodinium_polyedra.AAC.1